MLKVSMRANNVHCKGIKKIKEPLYECELIRIQIRKT